MFNLNPQNQHYTEFLVIDEKANRIQQTESGGYSPCVTAHYHKVGWKDILNANQIPHFGILVIDEPDTDELSQRLLPNADEPSI